MGLEKGKHMVTVRVIRRKGQGMLVEWREGEAVRRAIVPAAAVQAHGDEHVCAHPEQGIPYGVAWEELITLQATPEAVAAGLRRAGIWTYEDLRADPHGAIGAFQRVYAMDAQALREAARRQQEENHHG